MVDVFDASVTRSAFTKIDSFKVVINKHIIFLFIICIQTNLQTLIFNGQTYTAKPYFQNFIWLFEMYSVEHHFTTT